MRTSSSRCARKGVFDQMQVSQINLLRHGRWQVMAQKISRHLRMT